MKIYLTDQMAEWIESTPLSGKLRLDFESVPSNDLKIDIHSYPLDVQHQKNSNKPASFLAVQLGKTLNGILPL